MPARTHYHSQNGNEPKVWLHKPIAVSLFTSKVYNRGEKASPLDESKAIEEQHTRTSVDERKGPSHPEQLFHVLIRKRPRDGLAAGGERARPVLQVRFLHRPVPARRLIAAPLRHCLVKLGEVVRAIDHTTAGEAHLEGPLLVDGIFTLTLSSCALCVPDPHAFCTALAAHAVVPRCTRCAETPRAPHLKLASSSVNRIIRIKVVLVLVLVFLQALATALMHALTAPENLALVTVVAAFRRGPPMAMPRDQSHQLYIEPAHVFMRGPATVAVDQVAHTAEKLLAEAARVAHGHAPCTHVGARVAQAGIGVRDHAAQTQRRLTEELAARATSRPGGKPAQLGRGLLVGRVT